MPWRSRHFRPSFATLVVSLAAALVLAACGGDSSSTTTVAPTPAGPSKATARPGLKGERGGGGTKRQDEEPTATTPETRELARQFPPPQSTAGIAGSAAAIEAGREACQGKTPLQVKEEFFAAAQANLEPEQEKLIAQLPSFQRRAPHDPSFAAGQLAATVYEMTLLSAQQADGFRGCVYELARQLSRELSPAP
jgi:hypothetical protein